jgi:Na+/proline symporter
MKTQGRTSTAFAANKCGYIGLLLSTIGLVALSLFGFWRFDVMRYATACSLLGAVVSAVGLLREPRRQAMLGLFLGLIVSLYLPTIFLPLFTRR